MWESKKFTAWSTESKTVSKQTLSKITPAHFIKWRGTGGGDPGVGPRRVWETAGIGKQEVEERYKTLHTM